MATRLEIDDHVATLTIDKPESLNALDRATIDELANRFTEASQDARAVVVTGAGEKAFAAGADIAAMKDMSPKQARAFSRAGHNLLTTIEDLDIPTIAAINGFALGGGLELALACDIRVASQNASFGVPEVTLGVIPGFGGTQRLTRILGLGPGLDLLLTGRRIDAGEAHRLGLITRLVEEDQALAEGQAVAETIASNAPIATKLAKQTARRGFDAGLATGDQLEIESFGACFATEDQVEGMDAFLAKREANFEAR